MMMWMMALGSQHVLHHVHHSIWHTMPAMIALVSMQSCLFSTQLRPAISQVGGAAGWRRRGRRRSAGHGKKPGAGCAAAGSRGARLREGLQVNPLR